MTSIFDLMGIDDLSEDKIRGVLIALIYPAFDNSAFDNAVVINSPPGVDLIIYFN